MPNDKKIEIVNPNRPQEHVVCPFIGNLPIEVMGANNQRRPEVLPVVCQKAACVFYSKVLEKCKIELAVDYYILKSEKLKE